MFCFKFFCTLKPDHISKQSGRTGVLCAQEVVVDEYQQSIINKGEISMIKKTFIYLFILALGISLTFSACDSPASKGSKILIVEITSDKEKASEEALIRKALDKGGAITLSVEVARKIDASFDEKYTTSGSDGKFMVYPALLNFIGGQGWNFVQSVGGFGSEYFFVKNR